MNSAASFVTGLKLTQQTVEQVKAAYPEAAQAQMLAARNQLLALTWPEALMGGVERVLTMAVHIGLSLLVLLVFTAQADWLPLAGHFAARDDGYQPGATGQYRWLVDAGH